MNLMNIAALFLNFKFFKVRISDNILVWNLLDV